MAKVASSVAWSWKCYINRLEQFIFKKLKSVFSASVLLLIMTFRYHIVKVAVDPRGDSREDPQTTLTMLCFDNVLYVNKLSNCRLSLADASHEF